MAWKARLRSAITPQADRVFAEFDYYDDQVLDGGGEPVIVASHSFSFGPDWTNADMQSAIRSRGKEIRAAKLRADALAATFPAITTVIDIP